MHESHISPDNFSPDILEFFELLSKHKVRYLVVGGQAVIYYGYARFTGDINFFFRVTRANLKALYDALDEFWAGDIPGIESLESLGTKGQVIQFGLPPNRIDLINEIDGVEFDEAWSNKMTAIIDHPEGELRIYLIGLSELIKNKAESGRAKDLDDLRYLNRFDSPE